MAQVQYQKGNAALFRQEIKCKQSLLFYLFGIAADNVPDKNDIEWFKRSGGGRGSSYYGSSRSPSVLE